MWVMTADTRHRFRQAWFDDCNPPASFGRRFSGSTVKILRTQAIDSVGLELGMRGVGLLVGIGPE